MNDGKLDVVGCGSMVVDLFCRTPRIIGADEKILLDAEPTAGNEPPSVGGVVLNHLGWARVLSLEVGIFGKMGDDRYGEFLRAGMSSLGIHQHLTLDGSASSSARIFIDAAGNRAAYMTRGATAELRPSEIGRRHGAFIRRGRIVTTEISQLPLATVNAILLYARSHGIPTVLDVDVPPADACATLGSRSEFERALGLATIIKPAKRAAAGLAPGFADLLDTARTIRDRYHNRAVVITDGKQGCAIATDDEALRVPAFAAQQVDSTGAGDAFLGAMLAGMRFGLDWQHIGRLANAAGAVCVTRVGAFPSGFDLREQILALYGEPLPQAVPPTNSSGRHGSEAGELAEVERFFDMSLAELGRLRTSLDKHALKRAVEIIREAESRNGRVHVTGVGKPEHVARYAASLLCSVGTMATFLHATETLHGSLGQVHPRDVVIAVSNSGNTAELCAAAQAIKEHGATLIAITGNERSELTQLADHVIHAPVENEGGLLGLAPRISVLAQVFVLAALSVALEAARGLTLEEYSRWHRAGSLGEVARRLAARRSQPPKSRASDSRENVVEVRPRHRRTP